MPRVDVKLNGSVRHGDYRPEHSAGVLHMLRPDLPFATSVTVGTGRPIELATALLAARSREDAPRPRDWRRNAKA
jgi:hypothetical protein